jgi:hypothetical protein
LTHNVQIRCSKYYFATSLLRCAVSLAIIRDFSDALPSNPFFLSFNEEMLRLFGVFLFTHSSDDSTELANAETASESTSSAILKSFLFNTSMISLNEGRSFGLVDSPGRINRETKSGMNA